MYVHVHIYCNCIRHIYMHDGYLIPIKIIDVAPTLMISQSHCRIIQSTGCRCAVFANSFANYRITRRYVCGCGLAHAPN